MSHSLHLPPSDGCPGGIRELWAIALPMVISHACEAVMTFTDRLFLSRLGPHQMNASMAGGLTCFLVMTFFLGLTGYSTALVAQYLGAGMTRRCAVTTTQALILSLLGAPLIIMSRPLVHLIFARVGIGDEQLAYQISYFDILIYAAIIGLVRNCLACFFSGIGRTRIIMFSAVVAGLTNIGMNYLLIFGHWGFPALGIRGAAYGTIIGSSMGLLVLVAGYLSPFVRKTYGVMQSLHYDRSVMSRLLCFGYPAGIEMFLNLLAFNGMIIAFHAHSPATATAVTIMFNWDMLSFVPLLGIQIGVMSLVGRYMGAGTPDIAHRAAMSGLKTGWMYSIFVLVLFVFCPHQLVEVFQPENDLETYLKAYPTAVFMIRVAACYVMVESVVAVFSGALRGAGDTLWAMVVSVSVHWFLLVILIVILHGLGMSPESAWIALVTTFLMFSLIFCLRYWGGKWRNIRVVPTPAELIATSHDLEFHETPDL